MRQKATKERGIHAVSFGVLAVPAGLLPPGEGFGGAPCLKSHALVEGVGGSSAGCTQCDAAEACLTKGVCQAEYEGLCEAALPEGGPDGHLQDKAEFRGGFAAQGHSRA